MKNVTILIILIYILITSGQWTFMRVYVDPERYWIDDEKRRVNLVEVFERQEEVFKNTVEFFKGYKIK